MLNALDTSGAKISAAAAQVVFLNGLISEDTVASLYAKSKLAEAAVGQYGAKKISEHITEEEGGKVRKALAELNGNKIYLNPKWWSGGQHYYDDVATVMHELIHNVTGLTDDDFISRGFEDFSNVLKTKCF